MKTKTLLLTCLTFWVLLFNALTVKAQNCNAWNNPTNGTSNQLNSVCFTDANTGYAVGYYGTILKTINGGTNWITQTTGTTNYLYSVYFTDVNTGYAVGQNGTILKTVNGGTNWIAQSGASNHLYSVYFTDANTGYAVGQNGTILKTVNGGTNWIAQSGASNHLWSVYFTDATTGYAVGESGIILKTVNGGTNWITQTSGLSGYVNLYSVYFTDANTGYAVGSYGIILKTVNGGTNWIAQTSSTDNSLKSIYFTDANTGYSVGNFGTILKTVNGGTNWVEQTNASNNHIGSVYFTDANTGYAVGYYGTILKTVNGGTNWTIQTNSSSSTTNLLYSVYFTDANTGYAVGQSGTILNTLNGGTNWSTQIIGTNLYSVYFTDVNNGYVVGGNGTILKTINGGIDWTPQTSNTSNWLYSVYFTDVNTGYAVGQNGTILKTINGGTNWIAQSGASNNLWSVYFINTNTGYAVGYYGKILKTVNGGTNWVEQTSGTSNQLSSVYFTDANIGYAVGQNGTILKTINGGTNWIAQISSTNISLKSIYFTDVNTGYSVGDYGTILKTVNGGTNWVVQTNISTNHLGSVYFTDANTGYAVGGNGTILKTIRGGEPVIYPATITAGSIQRCFGAGTTNYTAYAKNATSYIWSISPTTAGTISGTDTIATVIWNPTYAGNATISVYGTDGTCNGNSTILNITTVSTATGAFSLTSPTNGVYTSATPLFSWGASSGANYYRLYIDGVLKKDNITSNSYQIQDAEALSQGMHTWYITAGGCPVQSNETWSFLVDATLPTAFNLISPADSSWTTNLTPTFTWNASSDVNSGLAKYQLWIDGVLIIDNISVSATSKTIVSNLSNGSHTWMIKAIDNVGNIRNSTQTYTIKVDNIAPVCSLKNPLYNQYLSTTTPNFSWSRVTDAGIGFQKSQLFIDDSMVQDNLSDSSWTITNPLSYGQHNWYIQVYDSLGNNQSISSRTFYIDNAKPNSFNLTSPTNNQIINLPTPNLTWQATIDSTGGSGMSKYQLWINGIINRDSIPISQTTVVPSGTGLAQGVYTWFIKAYDKVGNNRQSNETRTFVVDWESPTAFNLIEPIDNYISTVSRPQFKWHSSSDIGGLQRYELCISGQTPVIILPSDTTKLLTFDLPNNTYTWYVKAYDIAGTFTGSNTYTLTVNDPLPNQSVKPTGTNAFCIDPANTDYTTTGANNATSYIWEITPSNAGIITGTGLTATIDWDNLFTGTAQIRVKGHNGAGDGMFSEPITVNISPTTIAGSVSGSGNICQGTSTGTLTLSGHTGSVIKWQKRLENNSIWSDIADTTEHYSEIATLGGNWIYRAVVQSGACSSKFSDSAIVVVNPLPSAAGTISGQINICQGQTSVTYKVPAITNATSYIWTLPTSAIGTSTVDSIIVNYSNTAVSGNIVVKGNNSCGIGDSSLLFIVNNSPTPVTITPNISTICESSIQTLVASGGNITFGTDTTTNITTDYPSPYSNYWGGAKHQILIKASELTASGMQAGYDISSVSFFVKSVGTTYTGNLNNFRIDMGHTTNTTLNSSSFISGLINVFPASNVAISIGAITHTFATPFIWDGISNIVIQTSYSNGNVGTANDFVEMKNSNPGFVSTNWYRADGATASSILSALIPSGSGNARPNMIFNNKAAITWSPITELYTNSNATIPYTSGANATTVYAKPTTNITYTATATSQAGCSSSGTTSLTVNPLPDAAGIITGLTTVCKGQISVTYKVPAIANATSYIWTLPNGATGTSSVDSIVVNYLNTATSSNITVKGNNSCGNGIVSNLAITVNSLPLSPGTISGPINVCQGQSSVTYTVPQIANATSYIWTLPIGATGSSTSNSITVDYLTLPISGNFVVKGVNMCGIGDSSILTINQNYPIIGAVGSINGANIVCQGQNGVTYNIPTITNATSYIWTLPNGVIGSSISNSIAVNYSKTVLSGNIVVKGINACSISDSAFIAITINPLPNAAGTITGLAALCQGQTSVTYKVSPIANATSYIWTLPNGAIGTSTVDSIIVNYPSAPFSGNIVVKGNNSCGIGDSSLLAVTVNYNPSPVTITPNISAICESSIQPLVASGGTINFNLMNELFNGLTSSFSTGAVTGTPSATRNTTYYSEGGSSYLFKTISTYADVNFTMTNSINLTGLTSAILTFNHICATQAGYDYGYVQYSTDNGSSWSSFPTSSYSGTGTLKNSVVSFDKSSYANWGTQFISSSSTPGASPATSLWKTETINIPAVALTSNQFKIRFRLTTDGSYNYYGWLIDNVNINGTHITSTTWSPITELYTNSNATIPYTTGTNATTVYAKPTTNITYTATATSQAGCSSSGTTTLTVNPLPVAAGTITGLSNVCKGQISVTYKVPAIANATSYIWTLPTGATGTSTVDSIIVNYTNTAVSGNITVKGHNTCGDGSVSTMSITVNQLPIAAGTITGLSTVCQGQTSVTYKVPPIANATSYIWTLPTGATGTSVVDSIIVNYSNTAISGNIVVKGVNACGISDSAFIAITVNPLPVAAGTITGLTTVCQGQTLVSYKVPPIANATSYIWTLPSGATGTSTVDSIIVSYSNTAISGNIIVKGNNSCGDGDSSFIAITVNPLPAAAGTITGQSNVDQGSNDIEYSVLPINNATSYIWAYSGTGATITGTTNNVTISFSIQATPGILTVKGHNDCGDGVISPNFPISLSNGINIIDKSLIYSIFPNPTNGIVTIKIDGLTGNLDLQILNIQGKVIRTEEIINNKQSYTQDIDLSIYPKGIYLVKLINNNFAKVEKIVLQ